MGYGNRTGGEYYAKAARLKPLTNSKQDEIRVWVSFLGNVRGTVVTNDTYTKYKNRGASHLKVVSADNSKAAELILKYLPMLAENAKYSYICDTGIHGGAFYHIEGRYNGKEFSTQASWPESCSSPRFDQINEFLRAVDGPL